MKTNIKKICIGLTAFCACALCTAGVYGITDKNNAVWAESGTNAYESFKVESVALRVPDETYGEGLRFKIVMSPDDYNANGVQDKTAGIILLPTMLLGEQELTVDLQNENVIQKEGVSFKEENGKMVTYVHVYGIPANYYATSVTVRAYVDDAESDPVYSTPSSASVAYVADYAYNNDATLTEEEKAALQTSYLTYDVNYHVDGAVSSTDKGIYGKTIAAPVAPEKAGYIFEGWWNKDFTVEWNFSETTIKGTTTNLYAKWREKNKIELNTNNSHDLFYFSKDVTKCTDYAAINISEGKYKITLFDDIAEVTSLTIGGVAITDFTYDAPTKTLCVSSDNINAVGNGTQLLQIENATTVYNAQVTVADYVITTANEIDTVIPYVQRNHTGETYVVLGNDIAYTGTYTDTYNSGSETEFQYQGTFDGRGYAISGFNCSGGGMFYQLGYYGTIKNLALIGATQTSANGGILVNMCYGKLDNLYVSGTSSGNGGIVGQLGEGWGAPSGAQATNCVVNVECTHSDGWWQSNGGVFGNYMAGSSTMVNCWSVSSTYQYVVKSTGTAVEYNNGSSLLSAWNGTLPEGFNGNWKLENGTLYFNGYELF